MMMNSGATSEGSLSIGLGKRLIPLAPTQFRICTCARDGSISNYTFSCFYLSGTRSYRNPGAGEKYSLLPVGSLAPVYW